MINLWSLGNTGQQRVFELCGVREVKAFVHPDRKDSWIGLNLVAQNISKMLGFADAPNLGHVRTACAPEIKRDRQACAGQDTHFDTQRKHGKERGDQRCGIGFVVDPGLAQGLEIDQVGHGQDDNRRQGRLWQEIEQGCKEQHRQRNQPCGDDGRHRRDGTRCEVDQRAAESARDRVAPGKRGTDIGRTKRDQFLVGIDFLPALTGQGFGDRHTFEKTDDRDQRRGRQKLLDQGQVKTRHRQRRQASRDIGHDLDPGRLVQCEQPDSDCSHEYRHQRTGLGDCVGNCCTKTSTLYPAGNTGSEGQKQNQ